MATPPPVDHVTTVIPARDEAHRIERCLRSIAVARALLVPSVTSSVVVVDDCSLDNTASIASKLLDPARDVVRRIDEGNAGNARRVGVAEAIARAPVGPERIWVCSTDADSAVPPDWFAVHLHAAEHGHVAIAGVVELDDAADPLLVERFRSTYVLHADGTHPHVHGANLGFRADAYLAAGGWSALSTGEDRDLWSRLRGHGVTASTTRLVVATASRLVGRAPLGFARELALHAAADAAA